MAWMLNEYSKFHGYAPVVVTVKPIVRSRWTTGCNQAATGSDVLILWIIQVLEYKKSSSPTKLLTMEDSFLLESRATLIAMHSRNHYNVLSYRQRGEECIVMSTSLQTLTANFRLLYAAGALKIRKSQSTLFLHDDRSFIFDVYLFIQMETLGNHGPLGGIDALLGCPIHLPFSKVLRQLIGRRASDEIVNEGMNLLSFKVVAGNDDKPEIMVTYKEEKREFAGLEVVRMINEPTADTITYAFDKRAGVDVKTNVLL
ncbi:putative mediator of RNA polymerase II transcription subunit 37c, partial [Tanacetum coccineum]